MEKNFNATLVRVSGNIASSLLPLVPGIKDRYDLTEDTVIEVSVRVARKILAEIERTEPKKEHIPLTPPLTNET